MKNNIKFLLIYFCFVAFNQLNIFAQNSEWTIYNTSNSDLPGSISTIAIDNQGNKWVGTYEGLAKFDGVIWEIFNTDNSGLPDNKVISITIDKKGDKWIGTYRGLAKFDGVNWTAYNIFNSGLPDNTVMSIAIDSDENKWIGTWNGGLTKFDGTNWTIYNPDNSGLPDKTVLSISIDLEGNKWIGTYNGGLAKFDEKNWTIYNATNSGLPANYVTSLAIDKHGNKWVGTSDFGLIKFDGVTWQAYNITNSALPNNYIPVLTTDTQNNLWIGSYGGLVKFDGTNWIVFSSSSSDLPSNDIRALAIDNQGYKWVLYYDGLAKFYNYFGISSAKDINCSTNTATLNAYINAHNESTTVSFEYGTTTNYGNILDATPNIISGNIETSVSSNISNLSLGLTYHYRVKVENTNGIFYSNDMPFFTKTPASFSLQTPTNGANTNATPIFQWNSSTDALYYQLYIDKKLVKDSIYSNSYQLTSLQAVKSGTHTWYILANEGCTIKSNETWSIKVDVTPPNVFNLIAPTDNKWSSNTTYKTKWSASSDAGCGLAYYQVWIDDKLYSGNISLDSTTYTINLSDGLHIWYVKAFDNVGNEKQSSQKWTIKVDCLPPIGVKRNFVSFNGIDGWGRSWVKYMDYSPNPFTVELWFQTSTTEGGKLIGYGDNPSGPSTNYDRHIYMTNDGKINFGVNSNGQSVISSRSSYNDGKWHHVAATASWSGISLFIDGDLITSMNNTGGGQSFNGGFWKIAYDNLEGWPNRPSSDYFKGNLADIRIWYIERTQNEIIKNKNNQLNGTEYGLSLYYHCDEQDGAWYFLDYSVSDYDAYLFGGYSFNNGLCPVASLCKLYKPEQNIYTKNSKLDFHWASSKDTGIGFHKFQLLVDDSIIKDNFADTTFNLLNPLSYGNHTWYLKGFDSLSNNQMSAKQSFYIDNAPPLNFNLNFPIDSSIIDLPTPEFSWNNTQDSADGIGLNKYQLIINKKIEKDSIPINQTSIMSNDALDQGTYTWYVNAFDKLGNLKKSKTQIFYIDYEAPKEFTLISPVDNETVEVCKPTFSWHTSSDLGSGLVRYEFTLSGFDVIKVSPKDTVLEFPLQIPDGKYTWFVKAFDRAGSFTASTEVFNLVVKGAKIYTIEGNVTYDNNANSPLGNVILKLKNQEGEIITQTSTDINGHYKFLNLGNETYLIEAISTTLVNNVDPGDALSINRNYIGIFTFANKLRERAADVNIDNSIDPGDALNINRFYIQAVGSFLLGAWIFEKPTLTISCENYTQNIKAICVGDVNADYAP